MFEIPFTVMIYEVKKTTIHRVKLGVRKIAWRGEKSNPNIRVNHPKSCHITSHKFTFNYESYMWLAVIFSIDNISRLHYLIHL